MNGNYNNKKIVFLDGVNVRGEKFHHCITVKKNTKMYSIKYYVDDESNGGWFAECSSQFYKLRKTMELKADCDDYGCLTQYGWVGHNNYSNRYACA